MQPLAASGNSRSSANTNVSTSLALSILDRNGNEIPIHTTADQPIALIIARDPNLIAPLMTLQNVSSTSMHNRSFNLHFVNLSRNTHLTVSVHLEVHPLDRTRAYWLIYRFDSAPHVNDSVSLLDGWSLLCPLDLTKNDVHRHFLDNQLVSQHQTVVYGLRELNATETQQFCSNTSMMTALPKRFDTPWNFSSNYELRAYTSGCYYLDSDNNWQSDGLTVSSSFFHENHT
jgi:hypothetical protein